MNNYFEKSVEPGFPAGIVLINEVMYNTETGKPEWVELVNVSGEVINIKNWSISDVLTTPTKSFITNTDVTLQPDEYIVIAKDTSFNSAHPGVTAKVFLQTLERLGNTSDGVVIYDFRNGIIDSLFYDSSIGVEEEDFRLKEFHLKKQQTKAQTGQLLSIQKEALPVSQTQFSMFLITKEMILSLMKLCLIPVTDNSEFIEFLNFSGDSVNVGGWEIS
ncbi:MAG: lamin tail domain-containing protein [Ignavibacteriales bacterium]|nr:lamin tail domain-containing protein [Ignavibacteriales bacterium]